MKILVLGLGNPILTDDGVGIYVARELRKQSLPEGVLVEESSLSSFLLLDSLVGYEKAIIIDSIKTKGGKAGQIYRLSLEDLKETVHLTTIHQLNLPTILQLGASMGYNIPRELVIYAIEVADNQTFSEGCTPLVQKAIPRAVRMVEKELLRLTRG